MSESEGVKVKPNSERVHALVDQFLFVCEGDSAVDTAAAAQILLREALITCAINLPSALANAEKLTTSLKNQIRKRMGN